MTAASVDVLLPTRDRPDGLARALASVDAVRAAEPSIDVRVHVIDAAAGAGLGPAAARNRAAAAGEAEFLALLDDDDAWVAPRLGPAIGILRGDPGVALVSGDAELASGGRFLTAPGDVLDHAALTADCSVCASTVTLRRADWEGAGGMDETLDRAEDYELWLRLTAGGRSVRLLRAVLATYDDRGGLSSDPVAMARATLAALDRSAALPPPPDRVGRLHAVVAHGLAKAGRHEEARAEARRALAHAPTARVAWTSMARAILKRDR